ncbi:MAG: hypothetical protein PHU05_02300 [Bacilli bacterium]|nr:hypothetical protein [Bacilli bacterium]
MKIRIKIFLAISLIISLFFLIDEVKAYQVEITPSFSETPYIAIIDDSYPYWYYWEMYDNALLKVSTHRFYLTTTGSGLPDCSNFLGTFGTGYQFRARQFDYTWSNIWQNNLDGTGLDDFANNPFSLGSHEIYSSDGSMLCVPTLYQAPEDSINFNTSYHNDEYVDIEVDYTLANESNKVEYSFNGIDWYDYDEVIRFNINSYLIARIVDSNNNYITSSTLNITALKYSEPTIKFLKTEIDDMYAIYIKYYDNDLTHKYQYSYNGSIFNTINPFNEITINPTINGYVVARIIDENNKVITSATFNFNNVDVPDVSFIERLVEVDDPKLGKLSVRYLDIYVSNIKQGYTCTMATNDKKYKIAGNCENGLDQLISSETYIYNTNIYIDIYSDYENKKIVKQYEYTFFYKQEILSIQDIIPFLQNYIDYNQDNLDNFKVLFNDIYMYIPDEFRSLILFVIVIQLVFITILLGGK